MQAAQQLQVVICTQKAVHLPSASVEELEICGVDHDAARHLLPNDMVASIFRLLCNAIYLNQTAGPLHTTHRKYTQRSIYFQSKRN